MKLNLNLFIGKIKKKNIYFFSLLFILFCLKRVFLILILFFFWKNHLFSLFHFVNYLSSLKRENENNFMNKEQAIKYEQKSNLMIIIQGEQVNL